MTEEKPKGKEAQGKEPIDSKTPRRLLRFINAARAPDAIAFVPKNEIPPDEEPDPLIRRPVFAHELPEREKLVDFDQAQRLLEVHDELSAVQGFFHIDQLRNAVASTAPIGMSGTIQAI